VGYVAVRWLGSARGTLVTGATGGLVSSTAVSLSFARESRTEPTAARGNALASGVLLAWVVMFARVVIEVAVVNAGLVARVLVPFSVMAAVAGLLAFVSYRQSAATEPGEARPSADLPLKNPFSLMAATRFGLLFAAVTLVVALTRHYSPGRGLFVVAALAGLTDVDAITLSMADYARQGGDATTAMRAIVIASLANTLVKCGLVGFLGSPPLRKRLLLATLVILAAGLGTLAIA
jgi:uncharacterized membrane protein (DUF4010 family)